ncbi:MAG: ubiquinol-cytochrome c reductase iron-sulfur subunit [Candidatus Acidiferrales bacterium]
MKDSDPQSESSPSVSRRKFGKWLTISGIAAALAAVWWFIRERAGAFPRIAIARVDEVPVGSYKIFQYPTPEEPCLLIRTAPDSYLAYSRLCTHTGCPVIYDPDDALLVCPCHGGRFALANGAVLAGPPRTPLPRILLEQTADEIYAVGISKV